MSNKLRKNILFCQVTNYLWWKSKSSWQKVIINWHSFQFQWILCQRDTWLFHNCSFHEWDCQNHAPMNTIHVKTIDLWFTLILGTEKKNSGPSCTKRVLARTVLYLGHFLWSAKGTYPHPLFKFDVSGKCHCPTSFKFK